MEVTIFSDMGEEINKLVSDATKQLQTDWVNGLIFMITISITVYILFYGYLILSGKKEEPVKDLLWDLIRFAIVISVLNNLSLYMDLVTGTIQDIKGFLVGSSNNSKNSYSGIDVKIANIIKLFVDSWNNASGITGTLFWIVQCVFMLPLCVGVMGYAIGIVASEITLIALLAVFPLFLFCYLWGWFKNMFSMWVQAVMGNCTFVLFLTVFSKVGFAIAEYTNKWVAAHEGAEVFIACFMYAIAGVITIYGIKLAEQLSSALSQVSVDRMSSAMTKNATSKGSAVRDTTQKLFTKLLNKLGAG
ncbi:type IV secretion system protein [Orbus wheelerorum]|uniref:type IV secretion system protein n=1 Tax=Orbus wheelerorum TaxID=3074111 RepID=UPI00370D46C4